MARTLKVGRAKRRCRESIRMSFARAPNDITLGREQGKLAADYTSFFSTSTRFGIETTGKICNNLQRFLQFEACATRLNFCLFLATLSGALTGQIS
jgi:hypothetical protein